MPTKKLKLKNMSVFEEQVRLLGATLLALSAGGMYWYLTYWASNKYLTWDEFYLIAAILFSFIIIAPVSLVVSLRFFKVRNWLPLSILLGISSASIFYSANLTGGSTYFSWPSSLVVLAVIIIVITIIQGIVVDYLRLPLFIRLIIGILPAIPVIAGYILLNNYQDKLDQANAEREYSQAEMATIQNYNFGVYVPSYTPAGYGLHSAANIDIDQPAEPTGSHYYSLEYLFGTNELGDPSPYTINSFFKGAGFQPPQKCGNDTPNFSLTADLSYACRKIGTSIYGEPIYYSDNQATSSNDRYFFTTVQNTEVTFATTALERKLPNDEVIKIINSLQRKNAAELRALKRQG